MFLIYKVHYPLNNQENNINALCLTTNSIALPMHITDCGTRAFQRRHLCRKVKISNLIHNICYSVTNPTYIAVSGNGPGMDVGSS